MNRRKFIQSTAAVLAMSGIAACHAQSHQNSQSNAQTEEVGVNMNKKRTLILVSHPYFEQSRLIRGLYDTATQFASQNSGVTVRHLDQIYGENVGAIDVGEETRLMNSHDRIVFVFPTHWFNITPMMKVWLNDVWGSVGPDRWRGKEMLIVTTAAGGSSTYGKNGRIGVPLADVFLPMKATALHCGMTYLPPLAFENASSSRLPEYQKAFVERLSK